MRRYSLFTLGALLAVAFFAPSARAGDDDRHYRDHDRFHGDLDHRAFHRELVHREAHRYPMTRRQHERLHDHLEHEAYHDRLEHRAYHHGYRPIPRYGRPQHGHYPPGHRNWIGYQPGSPYYW